MQLERERAQIVEYAQRMRGDGLVIGTSGNISARDGDLVAMTPSGLDYDDMRPELIAVVTLGGEQVEGRQAVRELLRRAEAIGAYEAPVRVDFVA
jgi:L-fuculose-phosphate aldolase